jgi:hypothetical protein
MEVPITQFRRDLFDLASRALQGEPISVTYKGKRLSFAPETVSEIDPETRFDRVTAMQIVNPAMGDLDDPEWKAKLLQKMEAEWEKDWADL